MAATGVPLLKAEELNLGLDTLDEASHGERRVCMKRKTKECGWNSVECARLENCCNSVGRLGCLLIFSRVFFLVADLGGG